MRKQIIIKDLWFRYAEPLIRGINCSIEQGEVVSFIGSSGSGKTTLLKLLCGLLEPQKGSIEIDDVSLMMQQDVLLPWLTVLENVMLPGKLGQDSSRTVSKRDACKLLEEVGLLNSLHLYPKELSGGMRQRTALVRTLLQQKPILLLDEPFVALDIFLREQLYVLIRKLKELYSLTIVLVTHDIRDALMLSNRIVLLRDGDIQKEFSISENCHNDSYFLSNLEKKIRDAFLENQEDCASLYSVNITSL